MVEVPRPIQLVVDTMQPLLIFFCKGSLDLSRWLGRTLILIVIRSDYVSTLVIRDSHPEVELAVRQVSLFVVTLLLEIEC